MNICLFALVYNQLLLKCFYIVVIYFKIRDAKKTEMNEDGNYKFSNQFYGIKKGIFACTFQEKISFLWIIISIISIK